MGRRPAKRGTLTSDSMHKSIHKGEPAAPLRQGPPRAGGVKQSNTNTSTMDLSVTCACDRWSLCVCERGREAWIECVRDTVGERGEEGGRGSRTRAHSARDLHVLGEDESRALAMGDGRWGMGGGGRWVCRHFMNTQPSHTR